MSVPTVIGVLNAALAAGCFKTDFTDCAIYPHEGCGTGGGTSSSSSTGGGGTGGTPINCIPSEGPKAAVDARCTQLSEMSSSSDTLHNVGVGMLIGGGAAALATGAYLLWPASKTTTGSTVRVVPVVAETGGAILATGTF